MTEQPADLVMLIQEVRGGSAGLGIRCGRLERELEDVMARLAKLEEILLGRA